MDFEAVRCPRCKGVMFELLPKSGGRGLCCGRRVWAARDGAGEVRIVQVDRPRKRIAQSSQPNTALAS